MGYEFAVTPLQLATAYAALANDETYWKAIGTLRINITGCPNNCAHAWVADIGLLGTDGGEGGSPPHPVPAFNQIGILISRHRR